MQSLGFSVQAFKPSGFKVRYLGKIENMGQLNFVHPQECEF